MLRVGIVGIGFMGMIHYLAHQRVSGTKVVAIATRDPKKRAGDWTSIQGNFGPRGSHEDLSKIACYQTPSELCADPNIDLVDICLPNDQHKEVAIEALRAGKHVLVEKPIAMTTTDADQMIAEAKKANRKLLVAHVLPFFPDFGYAQKLVQSGEHGKLLAMHLRRQISPPKWSDEIQSADKSGGPIIDLHIHDTHFVTLCCGTPKAVFSRGRVEAGTPNYVVTQYLFNDPDLTVSASSGAISQPSRPFTHGLELYFEKSTLFYEAGGSMNLFTEAGPSHPDLPSSDPIDVFAKEIEYAAGAINGGPSILLDASKARDALALCLAEKSSIACEKLVPIE